MTCSISEIGNKSFIWLFKKLTTLWLKPTPLNSCEQFEKYQQSFG
jgi:hypothetical protein